MSGTNLPPPALSRTLVLPVADIPADLLLQWPPKTPGTTQDYSLDVTAWAASQGELITGFTALVSAPGSTVAPLTAAAKPLIQGSNLCTVTLASGFSISKCAVSFIITTATRQLTLTCWIVVAQLAGVSNQFGGLAYIGTALDPGTAAQLAALGSQVLTETEARQTEDAALQTSIAQAISLATAAAAQGVSTLGSYTLMLTQFHEFEQVVEQQIQNLTGGGGPGTIVESDGSLDVTSEGALTTIGLQPTGIAAGTYGGLDFDVYGRFIGVAVASAFFLLTEAGQPILISGGAANTALAVASGSSSGTTSGLASDILLEDGGGQLLAEDGSTFLVLET